MLNLCEISLADSYGSSVKIRNGEVTYNIQHNEKYYCEDKENGNSEIYSPQEDCCIWNNDFWNKYGNNVYQLCLKKQKRLEKLVNQGECDKISVEKYEKDGSVCELEVTKKYKKVINTTCINGDASEAVKNYIEDTM